MKNKQNEIKSIPIVNLFAHPNNPNRMSKKCFDKLVRNIEHTGMYEPIIVRIKNTHNSELITQYEIINGHHRVMALKQLGYTNADVCIWDVDDRQTNILLTTLNRLSGTDILDKKLALLKELNKTSRSIELAKLLPFTSGQIDRYCNLKIPKAPAKVDVHNFSHPMVFFVNHKQKKTIDKAMSLACESKGKKIKPDEKAQAITHIAATYIDNNK